MYSIRIAILLTLLFALLCPGSVCGAETDDQRFVEGLRSRRLFRLAEKFCTNTLNNPETKGALRSSLAIELIRTYTEHAMQSPLAERPPLWQSARGVAQKFLTDTPDDPRTLLVALQDARSVLTRGEVARQYAQVVGGQAATTEAQNVLREAIRLLEKLDSEVDQRLRTASTIDRGAEFTRDELVSLRRHVRLYLARALRNQAITYPDDSADRTNSLTRAIGILTETNTTDPIQWQIDVEHAVCLRLMKQPIDARRVLTSLTTDQTPTWVLLRMRAEEIRLALDQGEPESAMAIIQRSGGRMLNGKHSPQLDLAIVETYVALWEVATKKNDEQKAKQWLAMASNMVRMMEDADGPYWTRRGEAVLSRAAGGIRAGGDTDVLERLAKQHYIRKEFEEAVAMFDKAAHSAHEQGDLAKAFALSYAAAFIQKQQNNLVDAQRRFREAALAAPDDHKAPRAHQQSIIDLAQLVRSKEATTDDYVRLLEEHIQRWPDSPTSDQARLWLGKILEHQRHWSKAFAALRGVTPSDPRLYEQAIIAAARCARGMFHKMQQEGIPTAEEAKKAANWFEQVATGGGAAAPERWSPTAARAAVESARILMEFTTDGYARAASLLREALQGYADAPAKWRAEAQSLQVIALAGGGQGQQAATLLQQLSGNDARQMLEVIEGIDRAAKDAQPKARIALAKIQLAAIARLTPRRNTLTPTDADRLEGIHASALAAAGKEFRPQAIATYEALVKRKPKDGALQTRYAKLLAGVQTRPGQEKALAQWRVVLAGSRPKSADWFHAKYGVALAHYQLGDKPRAAQMIRLLRTLHPTLGGPELKAKFENLLKSCGK